VATKADDTIIGTLEMKEAARSELLAMIREGRWPAPYEGDDQIGFDGKALPPTRPHTLKAAE
jgi:hypothetical protein